MVLLTHHAPRIMNYIEYETSPSLKPDPSLTLVMNYFDAHNHLQDERFAGDQAELVSAAREAGVAGMVVNGACEADWAAVAALGREYPDFVVPSFGYHPWYLGERTAQWREVLSEYLNATPGAVVGEIGLDRWKEGLPYEGQEEVFLAQLEMAARRNVAASVHCLAAWGRMHELLRSNWRPERGFLLHSYGGSAELVRPLAKLGAYFSFPGYYLHARKVRQREAFRQVPIERLLVETDAPDQLLPADKESLPLRAAGTGKALNHPGNLGAVYAAAAELRGMEKAEFATTVAANWRRLFAKG